MYGEGVTVGDVASCERTLAELCAAVDPGSVPVAVYEAAVGMEKLAAGCACGWRPGPKPPSGGVTAGMAARPSGGPAPPAPPRGVAHAEWAASEQLDRLPGTTDALRHGTLSTVPATVLAAAAGVDPAAEGRLVANAARASVTELREDCARVKAAADPDAEARHARIGRERSVRTFTDHEGAWNLHDRPPSNR